MTHYLVDTARLARALAPEERGSGYLCVVIRHKAPEKRAALQLEDMLLLSWLS